MNIEVKVIEVIKEYADAGNTAGMGSITGTSPSTNVGCTTGSNYAGGGGTVGSGDIGNPFNTKAQKSHGSNRKKKQSKFSKLFQLRQNYTGAKPGKMKKFNDFG